ncbi:hypothetical protein THF5H11_20754 [Vibrio jasicida]|nr:hypothetical protein THF5H11_20754 [Vibrio jasicida]CAH1606899.1 hypothetical protein THF5G08_30351 [Vibrio jasicida]
MQIAPNYNKETAQVISYTVQRIIIIFIFTTNILDSTNN